MLVWGSKGEVADLGVQETRACPTCEKDRPFRLALVYKVRHVWYLFKWVSEKKYLLVCDVCQRGAQLDTRAVEQKLTKPPIPWLHRYGWTIGVGLLVAVVGFGSVASNERATQTAAYLEAPRVDDYYVVNLAKLLKSPEHDLMYGVLRVKSVQADRVEFLTPKVSFNKVKGANRDISNGNAAAANYYAPETLWLTKAQLQGLKSEGALDSVKR